MTTPEPQKPANPPLSARILKDFPWTGRGLSLDVEFRAVPGFTVLFGPSGSGKTTLLDCVAGLTTPEAGRHPPGRAGLLGPSAPIKFARPKKRAGYGFSGRCPVPPFSPVAHI